MGEWQRMCARRELGARLGGDQGNLAAFLPILRTHGHWGGDHTAHGARWRSNTHPPVPPTAPWPALLTRRAPAVWGHAARSGRSPSGCRPTFGVPFPWVEKLKSPTPHCSLGASGAGGRHREGVPARPLPTARGGGNATSAEQAWSPLQSGGKLACVTKDLPVLERNLPESTKS